MSDSFCFISLSLLKNAFISLALTVITSLSVPAVIAVRCDRGVLEVAADDQSDVFALVSFLLESLPTVVSSLCPMGEDELPHETEVIHVVVTVEVCHSFLLKMFGNMDAGAVMNGCRGEQSCRLAVIGDMIAFLGHEVEGESGCVGVHVISWIDFSSRPLWLSAPGCRIVRATPLREGFEAKATTAAATIAAMM